MKYLIFIFIILSSIGCSSMNVEYVYIPQKCQTEIPPAIKPTDNIVENIKLITERLELMECKVKYCRGDVLTQCEGLQ